MASRLYPVNESPALIAKLVGVDPSVVTRHAEIEAQYKGIKATLDGFFRLPDTTDEQKNRLRQVFHIVERDEYSTMHDDAELGKVEHFKLYGWGRVCHRGVEEYGRETEPSKVLAMLASQGVTLPDGVSVEELGGVKWC